MTRYLMNTYNRLPVAFVSGEGSWLIDNQGKRYIDALCGISVTNLGHAHPAFVDTLTAQAKTLAHTSNLFEIDAQQNLAELLCGVANMEKAFFANSGAEANEAAIKLARLYAHNQGNHAPVILTFNGSFHGRTLGTIAATAGEKIKAGFDPVLPGFVHLPFNDIGAVESAFSSNANIAAVLVEPVQGEGGINIAKPAFLKRLASLCKSHDALFMLDEVQSGNGRCGRYFAHQLYDDTEYALAPDVLTTAKGLGNGFPVGACLARGAAASAMAPGKHGSTFGGNPLACTVAEAVARTIIDQQLADRATQLGAIIANGIKASLAKNPLINEIRHCGLMLGVELKKPCTEIMQLGLSQGIVLNVTADKVVRLLPPLTLSDDDADIVVKKTVAAIEEFTLNCKQEGH